METEKKTDTCGHVDVTPQYRHGVGTSMPVAVFSDHANHSISWLHSASLLVKPVEPPTSVLFIFKYFTLLASLIQLTLLLDNRILWKILLQSLLQFYSALLICAMVWPSAPCPPLFLLLMSLSLYLPPMFAIWFSRPILLMLFSLHYQPLPLPPLILSVEVCGGTVITLCTPLPPPPSS